MIIKYAILRNRPVKTNFVQLVFSHNTDNNKYNKKFKKTRPCLVHSENQNFFQDFPSHRILWYMHETLNIDENKN